MTVNDSEMYVRLNNEAYSIPEISPEIGEYRLRRKGRVTEIGFQLLKNMRG